MQSVSEWSNVGGEKRSFTTKLDFTVLNEIQAFTPSGAASSDYYGKGLMKMTGDEERLFVPGARTSSGGTVVYFKLNTSTGFYQQKQAIGSSITNTGQRFGRGIGITSNGDFLYIGAPEEDTGGTNYGRIFQYQYDSGNDVYTHIRNFGPPVGNSSTYFGEFLAVDDGGRFLVSMNRSTKSSGANKAVYVYSLNGSDVPVLIHTFSVTSWAKVFLTISGDGNTIVAINGDYSGTNGAIVYKHNGTSFVQSQSFTLSSDLLFPITPYGEHISMSYNGDTLAISGADGTSLGRMVIYKRDDFSSNYSLKVSRAGISPEPELTSNKKCYSDGVSVTKNGQYVFVGNYIRNVSTGNYSRGWIERFKYDSVTDTYILKDRIKPADDTATNGYSGAILSNVDGTRLLVGLGAITTNRIGYLSAV